MKWILCKDELPKEYGKYLITRKMFVCPDNTVETAYFSNNLKEIDEYDFDEERAGFFSYDEGGYYEIKNVVAWMECPYPYKEKN